MKICPNCLSKFEDHLKFCRNDGTPLQAEEVQTEKLVTTTKRTVNQSPTKLQVPIEGAENLLNQGRYKEALANLENVLKQNPGEQTARLLHLLASIRLYNIYGYEKQIDAIRRLADLSDKDQEIAREIFLIRSEEAGKQRRDTEAREYQRLAARVLLGQSLAELAAEPEAQESSVQQAQIKPFPQKVTQTVPSTERTRSDNFNVQYKPVKGNRPRKAGKGRLLISFVLVFGLAGVLVVGMLGYYAKKQGVNISDIFTPTRPATQQLEVKPAVPEASLSAQVLAAEELGFKVAGDGAENANRQASVISEQIGSQLSDLRKLYQQEVEKKPELVGSVLLQLTIGSTGEVSHVEACASRMPDEEFKKTLVNEVYKWRFPEANVGSTKVNYPLLFVPPKMDVATVRQMEKVANRECTMPDKPKERVRTAGGSGGKSKESGVKSPVRPPPPPPPVTTGQYEVLYPTSVYSEPREDSQRVAQIEAGTKINVVEVRGEWLEVRSRQGRPPGFVKKDAARPLR
jgi:tetratricopeptide (TPR) repeat protein